MNENQQLIEKFYTAFVNHDGQKMADCYHHDSQFSDPVFGSLDRISTTDMWNMLLERSKGSLRIEFYTIETIGDKGSTTWAATYNFSKTNRKVVNIIQASFEFKDGLIYRHTDTFDLWKWSRQALGWKGLLLGWTKLMQKKIQSQAKVSLENYKKNKVNTLAN